MHAAASAPARPAGPRPVTTHPLSLLAYMRRMRRDVVGRIGERFERYGDIYYAPFLGRDVYVLRHPEHIRQVLIDSAASFGKPVEGLTARELKNLLGEGLLTSNGELWREQRRRVQPAFRREHLAQYTALAARYAAEACAKLHEGEQVDVSAEMMGLTLRVVTKALFNRDVRGDAPDVAEAMRLFRDTFGGLEALLPQWLPLPARARKAAAQARVNQLVYRWIDEERAAPSGGNDLLSVLAAPDESGQRMDRQLLRDELLTLFLAGHETTSHALSWTFFLLSQHPEVEARVHEEVTRELGDREPSAEDCARLTYTEQVLSESMRLYPPAYSLARVALEDTQVGAYRIPAGADVVIWIYHAHHDPRWFPDPERFDPERFAHERARELPQCAYLPFGAGTRTCIGKRFAMWEAQVILATYARRLRFVRDPDAPKVSRQFAITLAPKPGLPMRVVLRQ